MSTKQRWLWEFYFVIIILFAAQKLARLISPESPSYIYYLITRIFNPVFYLHYTAHILQVLLNIIHCIPLILFIHRIRFLKPELWRFLLVCRCVFDIFGHAYEMNTVKALYQTNPKLLSAFLVLALLPQVPSYCACFWYAFRQDKLFS